MSAPRFQVTGLLRLTALKMGLRFKLVLMTGLVVLSVILGLEVYYQVQLSDEFIENRKIQLESAVKFLQIYGKNHFQTSTYDPDDLRLLLEPFLKDPEFRFVEIRDADGNVIFNEFSDPLLNDWIAGWKAPDKPAEVSGEFAVDGERIVFRAVPFFGPKEAEIRDEIVSIESLFGDEAGTLPSVEAPQEQELKVWVIVGAGARRMLDRLSAVRAESLTVLVPIVLAALILTYLFISWTVRPLLRMSEMASNIAQGNFHDRVSVDSEDEIGELAIAFNRMADQIAALFGQLGRSVDHLLDVSHRVRDTSEHVREGSLRQHTAIEEASASVEEMNRSIREIDRNIEFLQQSAVESSASITEMGQTINEVDRHMELLGQSVEGTVVNITELTDLLEQVRLSIRTLQQASEETASSMHQVDANIRHIKESTESATALSEGVFEEAKNGKLAVERTREGIQEIERFASEMSGVIQRLGETSEQIVGIIDVIQDISDRTNLLALNAAIIAAQAGDQGSGFSVVARQIKELSEQTADSIQAIARLIEDVQTESRRAADAMRQSRDAITAGRDRAEDAEQALESILSSTESVLDRVRSIEQTTAEQSRGSHQVAMSIQQVAEMVSHLAQNTEAQGSQADALRKAAQNMQNIAQQVRRTTSEQSTGSKMITQAIERITEMVRQIARSLKEQRAGSDRVLEVTDEIRQSAETNLKYAQQQTDVVRILNEEIARFQRLLSDFSGMSGEPAETELRTAEIATEITTEPEPEEETA